MPYTRRDFLITSACLAGGLLVDGSGVGLAAPSASEPAVEFAPPGEFKVKYFGRFSELPIGSVRPGGWIADWLDRQLKGLTGHPENLAYPFDTCMYAGKVTPPPAKLNCNHPATCR